MDGGAREDPARFGPLTRGLAAAAATAFLVLGVTLFFAPSWATDRFPWGVSAFVAMTIGAWSLGTAVMAALVVFNDRIADSYACLVFLGAFGLFELVVVLWHRDVLATEPVLWWIYFAAMDLALLAGISGVFDATSQRGAPIPDDARAPDWFHIGAYIFIVVVAILAAGALIAPAESVKDSNIFPVPASKFTFRAFGAFYAALVVGAISLAQQRRLRPIVLYVWGGIALIVPITIAALVYVNRFHVGDRPGRLGYIALYFVVLAAVIPLLWQSRTSRSVPE